MWYKSPRAQALIVALVIVAGAFAYRIATNPSTIPSTSGVASAPSLQVPGSAHTHESIFMSIYGQPVDLYAPQYLDRDEHVHFHPEDTGGFFIHVHAKGVTLPYFLETLGMKLTKDCLTLEYGQKYCNGSLGKLTVWINRAERPDLSRYELEEGDKILVDFGTSTPTELMLEANGIPDLPATLSDSQ